jgi:hypothetical protein
LAVLDIVPPTPPEFEGNDIALNSLKFLFQIFTPLILATVSGNVITFFNGLMTVILVQ